MHEPCEPFCLDIDGQPDIPPETKKQNRIVGYITAFLAVFTLGTTEIFASWYTGILGGTPLESGLAMGVFGLVYMFSPAMGGKLSDRLGRKKTLLLATGAYIAVISMYLLPFITPIYLIMIRAVEGFVYGFIAPTIEGMVAELEPESQVATLGNFSTSWSASMILPPMVIAYMAGAFGNVSSIWIILILEAASLVILFKFLSGYRRRAIAPSNATPTRTVEEAPKSESRTSPVFIASYLSVMLWGVVSTVILALFPTYIEQLITLGHPFVREDFGNLLLLWNIARTAGFMFISTLSGERMKGIIVLGVILSGISGIMLFLFIDIWIFAVAMAVSGVGVGFCYLGALYLVVAGTEVEKGANAGLVESMGGVGLFIGPIIGGWLMDISLELPYLMYAGLSAAILVPIVMLLSKSKSQ
ncbi:MAG: MFS transporter [Candidatus Thorarchaeota archaeon]|nr:MFS transporter [Candidatus Thorarchaeota archaeon]